MERARLHERAQTLKRRLSDAGLPLVANASHIVPVTVGDPVHCKAVTDTLLDRYAIYAQPINYPTVPRGTERIRLTPSPVHTNEQMDYLVHSLTELWQACPLSRGEVVRLAAE
jgi:5-aminolevulinate synthase